MGRGKEFIAQIIVDEIHSLIEKWCKKTRRFPIVP